MAADPEVVNALKQAVQEQSQPASLEKALVAWLNAMSENELAPGDHIRHLESVKHAVQLKSGDGEK
jgi:predicted outer membrane protein